MYLLIRVSSQSANEKIYEKKRRFAPLVAFNSASSALWHHCTLPDMRKVQQSISLTWYDPKYVPNGHTDNSIVNMLDFYVPAGRGSAHRARKMQSTLRRSSERGENATEIFIAIVCALTRRRWHLAHGVFSVAAQPSALLTIEWWQCDKSNLLKVLTKVPPEVARVRCWLFFLYVYCWVFFRTELWINANMAFCGPHKLALCVVISPHLLVSTIAHMWKHYNSIETLKTRSAVP